LIEDYMWIFYNGEQKKEERCMQSISPQVFERYCTSAPTIIAESTSIGSSAISILLFFPLPSTVAFVVMG
jgi:hypothetical protein